MNKISELAEKFDHILKTSQDQTQLNSLQNEDAINNYISKTKNNLDMLSEIFNKLSFNVPILNQCVNYLDSNKSLDEKAKFCAKMTNAISNDLKVLKII